MSKFHSTVSRKDFLKVIGLGSLGMATAAAGTYVWAKEDAAPWEAMQGWENAVGKEYFDRKPFEVDTVPEWNWKVIGPDLGGDRSVGGIHRYDGRTSYNVRHLSVFHNIQGQDSLPDGSWPSSGTAALDPYWQDWYELNPMMLDRDKAFKYDWWPNIGKPWVNDCKAEKARWDANEGYLGLRASEAYMKVSYPDYTDPPAISDWKDVSKTRGIFNSPEHASSFIKKLAHMVGMTLVTICRMNPAWVVRSAWPRGYPTSAGRGWPTDGNAQPIPAWWEYAIMVTPPMFWDTLYGDPNYGTSWQGYERSRHAAWQITYVINKLGYPARAHWPGANYNLINTPVGVESGEGMVGRTSNVVSPDFGGNFRQAVITTSLPMAVDKPIDFALPEFCRKCKLCAEVCPTGAISYADDPDFDIRGVRRWYIDQKKCRTSWNIDAGPMGCRACVAVCPWSKKNTWVHRFVRDTLSRDRTGIGANVAIWAEKNFYKKNLGADLVFPKGYKGVYEPAVEWHVTDNYISGFTDTPMGVK